MAKSLPPVSQKVIADAEQFIAEFRRAEQAARRTTSRVDAEVTKLSGSLNRKFSLSGIGKSLLGGIGLGSGFAAAQMGAEVIAGYWQRAAEAAKSIEESIASQLKGVRDLVALRQDDRQKLQAMIEEEARLQRELAQLNTPRMMTRQTGGNLHMRFETVARPFTNEELARRAQVGAELQKIALDIERQRQALAKKAEEETTAAIRKTTEELQKRTVAQQRELESLEKVAEKYRQMADPTREFALQLEEIEDLFWGGALSATEAAKAIDAVNIALAESLGQTIGQQEALISRVFGEGAERAGEMARAAQDIGWAFQSSFESAIIHGEKLSDVLKGLAQDVARVFLRLSITNPLINTLFGGVPGFSALPTLFGGARAAGGPVSAGRAYLVGEDGPEMVVPRAAGTVVPNHALRSGGGGGTFYIDARGADRTGLARLEAMIREINGSIEPRAVAAVGDWRRRGASFA